MSLKREGDFLDLERSAGDVLMISLLEARLDKGLVSDRRRSLGRALLGVFVGDDPALFTVLIVFSGLWRSRAVNEALVLGWRLGRVGNVELLNELVGSVTLGERAKVMLALDEALIEVDLVGGAGAFLSSLNSAAVFLFDLNIAAGMVFLVAEPRTKLEFVEGVEGVVSPEDLDEEFRFSDVWEARGERVDSLDLVVRLVVALVLEFSLPMLLLEAWRVRVDGTFKIFLLLRDAVKRAVTWAAVEFTLRPAVGACRLLLLVGSLLDDDEDLLESPESERDVTGADRLDAGVVVRLLGPIDFLTGDVGSDGFPGLIDVVRSGGVGGLSPLSFLTAFLFMFKVSGIAFVGFSADSTASVHTPILESSDVGVFAERASSSSADLLCTRLSMLRAKLDSSKASQLALLLNSFLGKVGVPGGSSESKVLLIDVRCEPLGSDMLSVSKPSSLPIESVSALSVSAAKGPSIMSGPSDKSPLLGRNVLVGGDQPSSLLL